MAYVSYIAQRGMAPGHVVGATYGLTLSFMELARPNGGALRQTSKSLDGHVETLFFGEERIWSATLSPVRICDAAIYYEFLRSTADGQVFAFDPYGTEGTAVELMSVIREDQGYTEAVFQREGRTGRTDWVTLSFQVRET